MTFPPFTATRSFDRTTTVAAVLYIPSGYANGAMSLTPDATVMYFSTATMEETKEDDVRYDARYWDCWGVEER